MENRKWPIANLKENPDQKEIYGELGEVAFESLVADIKKNGLRHPIEVADSGIIIDGHQRVRAYVELGFVEIEVAMTKGLDADEVKERFISANLNRRQLDPITKARALKALAEIECVRRGTRLNAEKDLDFREHLARLLGGNISGRTVGRYLQLLRLPRPIQDVVSSGDLPMTTAIKIESLGKLEQLEIATRIATGEHPKQILIEYFPQARTPVATNEEGTSVFETEDEETLEELKPGDLYRNLIEFFQDNLEDLAGDIDSLIGSAFSPTAARVLRPAISFCEQMLALEIEATKRMEEDLPDNVCFGRPL